jgi:4-hydroxybenzoate polyprenyltransferase
MNALPLLAAMDVSNFNAFNLIGLASLGVTLLSASIIVVNRSRDARDHDREFTP